MTSPERNPQDLESVTPVSLRLETDDRAAFDTALLASFERFGFAVLSDHGVPKAVIDDALGAMKAFFTLDEAAKRAYHVLGGGGARGYTPFGVETAKGETAADLKEFWHVGRALPPGHRYERFMPPNLEVREVPGWKARTSALYDALDAAGRRVLRAIARGLRLPEDFWDAATAEGNSVLRLLHYPPVKGAPESESGGSVRAAPHGDINVITLLLGAEEAGLQILDRDGRWLPIAPPEGALVINIGDMLERQTNDVLPSTTHRVINPAPERAAFSRYSTPFFLHFAPDYLVKTLPGCVSPERPDRYPEPITAEDFLQQRLREIKLI
jgi:isopenicillin N synthase-like dioxygenase